MNKTRRSEIEQLVEQLRNLKVEIDNLGVDESDALESLPENLQDGDQGARMQAAVDALEFASDTVDEVIEHLEEAAE